MKGFKRFAVITTLFILNLASSVAFGKTVYLTDLEGRIEPLNQLIKDGTLLIANDGTLDFSDPETKLVFGGDLMDRGPHTLRLMRFLVSLKQKYPERVNLIWGNRDLNKLSFSIDREEKMANLQDVKYREFLDAKLNQMDEVTRAGKTVQSLNTPENQVQWWAEQYGLTKAVEFHQQELRELRKTEVTYSEAARDFADMISNPKREYLNYIKLGQLVHSEGAVVYIHGGLPAQNGFVPESAVVHESFADWERALNGWGHDQIREFISGITQGQIGSRGNRLVFYGDALYDSNIKKVWNHDNSVVYGPRFKEGGNFRLPSDSAVNWLKANGKSMLVLGHSPAGNIPTPLRGQDILVVMADTSYSPNGVNTKITIDGERIEVKGKLENGTDIHYQTSARDRSSPIGLRLGEEAVVAKTSDGRMVLFKYVGYEKHERVISSSEAPFSSLKIPTYEENAEFETQKRDLLKALAERGTRVIELNTFEGEFLNGRRPVLFSGSSAYADPTQESTVRQMIEESLRTLDPSKAIIVTGATDKGPEKLVHEIASRLGFYVHGLVVSAAVPQDVSKKVNSVSWVGHDWANQPKTGMDFIRNNNGFGIILGGGGLLQKGLEYGRSIGAKFIVASNVKHGNGAVSASMNFAPSMRESSFADASALARILKRSFYRTVKKSIIESTAEQAISALKGRGKQVVTFIGFSGAGYQDQYALMKVLRNELSTLDPKKSIINIGGTPDGIGALYEIAKQLGFETAGIVSTQAKAEWISPYCDRTYMIKDTMWGGFVNNTRVLSPTSRAMIGASDSVVAVGGGAVGRDEFITAKERGLPVKFVAAEMDRQKAIAKAAKAGKPAPTEFRGDLEIQLERQGLLNSSMQTWNQRSSSVPRSGSPAGGGNKCADLFLSR